MNTDISPKFLNEKIDLLALKQKDIIVYCILF
jgi:hypothetical protein